MRMLFKNLQEHLGKRITAVSHATGFNQADSITIIFEDKSEVILRGGPSAKLIDPPSKTEIKFHEN